MRVSSAHITSGRNQCMCPTRWDPLVCIYGCAQQRYLTSWSHDTSTTVLLRLFECHHFAKAQHLAHKVCSNISKITTFGRVSSRSHISRYMDALHLSRSPLGRSAMGQRYQLLTRAFQCQKMLNVPGQTLMVCSLAVAERRTVLASDAHCSAERTHCLRRAVDCLEKTTADLVDAAAGLAENAVPWAELALLRNC